jgi:hypothetical protein
MAGVNRIVLWIGLIIFFLGISATVIGFIMESRTSALLESGVQGQGTITYKSTKTETSSRGAHQVYYMLNLQIDDKDVTVSSSVSKTEWEALKEGDKVRLLYLPTDPSNHVIGDRDKARTLENRGFWTTVLGPIAVLLGLGFIGLYFRRRKRVDTR